MVRRRKKKVKKGKAPKSANRKMLPELIKRAQSDGELAFYYRKQYSPAKMFQDALRDFVPPMQYATVWVYYPRIFHQKWLDIRARRAILK